jgi:hypothetical protein
LKYIAMSPRLEVGAAVMRLVGARKGRRVE